MFQDRELIRLAARKATLQREIVLGRTRCIEAAARVAQPLAWLDRVAAFWRRLSPLAKGAALPLGFFVQRFVFRRMGKVRSLVRWGPLIVSALRVLRSVVRSRSGFSGS